MSNNKITCIDAGSEYCPCYLAENQECITCSQLQGKGFCNCNWSGVCIYKEFYWCGKKKKDTRMEYEAHILEKRIINENALILKIKVTKTLARQLKQPGAYIFIRNINKPTYFDVPMSLMYADEQNGEIEVAIQILGVKTKSLLDCEDTIYIKGPYWNGILGLKNLKILKEKDVLVLGRGIAQAPAVLTIKYLLKNNNRITFITDPGKIGEIFVNKYIDNLNIESTILNITTEEGMDEIKNLLRTKNYSLVFSGGSDILHTKLKKVIENLNKEIILVTTNNSKICCGEGICGSCSTRDSNGKKIKMCKSQIDDIEIFEGGRIHD